MQTRTSRLLLLLLAGLAAWLAPTVAAAQAMPRPAAATAAPSAPSAAPAAVAPSQARQALDVLRDDRRRGELITTLEAIANAGPSAGTTAAAGTPAPEQPLSKLPLEPDSLGAELVTSVSAGLTDAGSQLVNSVRAVNDLPLLWRWLVGQVNDPDARARVFDASWKLAVVVGAGLFVEFAVRHLLGRVRASLTRAALSTAASPPPPDNPADHPADLALDPAGSGEHERSARARRLNGALNAIRRLPLLLGRLLLDLVPIALFAVVGNILAGGWFGTVSTTKGAILLVVQCYVAARVVLALSEMLLSPAGTQLRLLHVSDWAAEFLTRWIRRVAVIGITGYAVAGVGLQFGMYRTAYDALLKLFALVVHACLVVAVLEARVPVARRIRARPSARGPWAILLNRLADTWHLIAIFYIVALWLVWAVELRNGYVRLVHFFVVTAGVLVASRLVAMVLLGGLDRARGLPGLALNVPGFEERATAYYPILRSILLMGISVATTITLLEVWGLGVFAWFEGNNLGRRSVSALLLIGTTVFLAVVVWECVNAAVELHLARLSRSAQLARAGRLRTLLPMLRTVLLVLIVLVVALMSLDELGVNIAPLLAGAGVVGIAVGFGSQKLVQDLITGLFLLLENAMQVGDVVTLGGLTGTVEALSIRTIRLRALDGSVHIIPFSAVTTVTNQTRDYGYAVIDVSVGLNEEPERIVDILKQSADGLRRDPRWQSIVLEPLDVMGVEKFVDLAWVMRVRMKTQPASRWAVARELNRRFKVTFDELGIESPFTSHRALSSTPGPADAPEAEPQPTEHAA